MIHSDYSSDRERKEIKPASGKSAKQDLSTSTNKPKYSQRFCEKWLKIFHPWLARCDDNPNKPFCRACQCRLDCNRCRIQRHERTSKHARNLDTFIKKRKGAALETLSIRREANQYQQRKKQNIGNESPSDRNYNTRRSMEIPTTNERRKIFMQIQKDKNALMDSFNQLMGSSIVLKQPPPREKSHVDLFFDSVSSSVKALTPKLIVEAKMRVTQLICELELRALTENDVLGNSTGSNIIVSADAGNSFIVNEHANSHQQESKRKQHYEAPS